MTALLSWSKRAGAPLLATLAALVLWELIVRALEVPAILVPAPTQVLSELAAFPAWFALQTLYTLWITIAGFVLATVIGVAFAVLLVEFRPFERTVFPLFVALNSVPKVAVAPLFVIWFGTGDQPKIAIAFLLAIFAIVIDGVVGLRSVSPDILDLARVLRGGRLKVLWRIKLPCALPSLFAGLKVAMSLSIVGAIIGEFVSSQRGLGYVILAAQGNFDTPRVFAAIFLLAILGVVLIALLDVIERRVTPWKAARGH